MPVFDLVLAEQQCNLSERPLQATIMFVTHCIIDITGDSKGDFWKKTWFKGFHKSIKGWYKNRYGASMSITNESFSQGIMLLYETPFELRIPLNVYFPEKVGVTTWVVFPNSVLPEENIWD